MAEIDDDAPALSAETFAALQQFYDEQDARDTIRSKALAEAAKGDSLDIAAFDEDWQLSQFWYDDATAEALAEECERLAREHGDEGVACVSCPTLYLAIKKHYPALKNVKLFEYDQRFARCGEDFVFYDYKAPLDVPRELREKFGVVFADPPFLSAECLTKTAVTVKFLAKDKIILCSGRVMEGLAHRLLSLKMCDFKPQHRNNLANEFCCYANFDLDANAKVENGNKLEKSTKEAEKTS